MAVSLRIEGVPTPPRLALRDYQQAAIEAAYRWHTEQDGACLLVVPTGGGKSLIMGTLAREAVDDGARVLVIAHRKELLEQNWKALQHAGLRALDCGIISGQLGRKDRGTAATVGSIQTLARQPFHYGPFDLILLDEAHLVPRNEDTSYRKFLDAQTTRNPAVRAIGLTATPYRLDSGRLDQGEGRVFHDVAYEITIRTLLDGGYLAPLISKATLARYDVSGVATRGGDYLESALQSKVDDPETTRAIVAELVALGTTRQRWLVFAAGVQHAEHLADALTAAGVPAAAVHGALPPHERAARLAALRNGTLRALTNCDVLTTGYDEPSIDLLALCRPTASTGLHVQMLGRGLRTAPGKTDCLVLDFAGNCLRHGPVDAVRVRDPKKKGAEAEAPAKQCPECAELVATATRICPRCQHAFPPPERAKLAPTALLSPVMAHEKIPPKWYDITETRYSRHEPKAAGKRPTLRADHYFHFQRIASEWVCLEHDGFARDKAVAWWGEHLGGTCPTTIMDALARVETLEQPTAIALQPDGQFDRVVDRRFANARPTVAPPRVSGPCFFCARWDDLGQTCTQWGETPPSDIRLVGCEAYTDADADDALPF